MSSYRSPQRLRRSSGTVRMVFHRCTCAEHSDAQCYNFCDARYTKRIHKQNNLYYLLHLIVFICCFIYIIKKQKQSWIITHLYTLQETKWENIIVNFFLCIEKFSNSKENCSLFWISDSIIMCDDILWFCFELQRTQNVPDRRLIGRSPG